MAYVIPTTFTAIDNMTATVQAMQRGVQGFATRAETAFNKVTAPIARASSQMLAFGESALLFGGAALSIKAIGDYGTEIANLSAVTGAVGPQLDLFKSKITEVAIETKRSAVDVAQAFTAVDNNMPVLHKNAEALAEVTKQSIILAKASRLELQPAAEALTMSMNQFGLGADKAQMAVDAMAAGAVAGSSRMAETSEALQKFGTVAANVAHVTFAESVALVELASKFEKGSEAGVRLRNILLNMTNIKFGPAAKEAAALGVNLNKVSDTSLSFIERFQELSKIKGNPEAMEKLFDKRNVAMASGLFSVIDKYQSVLDLTTKTGMAEQMATTNTDNLAGAVQQLQARWVTYITTNDKVNSGVNFFKNSIQLLTDHLEGIMSVVGRVVEAFIVYKALTLGLQGATLLFTAATKVALYWQGVATVMTGRYATAAFATASGIRGMATASFFLEAGLMGSIGAIGIAITAIGALSLAMGTDFEKNEQMAKSLDKTENGFRQIREPISQAQIELEKYNEQVDRYNASRDFQQRFINATSTDFLGGLSQQAWNALRHPVDTWDALNGMTEPVKPDTATKDAKATNTNGKVASSDKNAPIYLSVNVDKNGAVNVSGNSGNGSIPVVLGATSSYTKTRNA